MTEPPRRPLPPRPSPSRPKFAPPAMALGRAEPDAPDSNEEMPRSRDGHLGTIPIRPLIDIGQPKLTITIESENGKPSGRSVVHDGDVFRIGSHPSNALTVDDPAVSGFHCRIVPDDLGWRVEDSGSTNGTYLQKIRIVSAVLPTDATLEIGQSIVRIRAEAASRDLVPMMPQFGSLTGTGKAMRKLFTLLEKVAASDINCLIHGESGTGKELVATEIVQRGDRADRPFVVVDCGAISPNIIESELFGHVRGAFTGADRDRVGAFEAADGGTVFLDEIGELPLAVQPKLLRALEQREIRRVGETHTRKVSVRVISATNRDLEKEVNRGSFRGDLYFRLAVITVRVPALRERREDLPYLIRAFLEQMGAESSDHLFPDEVIEELARHEWPGNVRELRNYVERSVVLQTARISLPSPPTSITSAGGGLSGRASDVDVGIPFKVAKDALIEQFERAYLRGILEVAGGNMTKAARMAGIDRMYLHRLVQKHGSREQLASVPDAAPSSARKSTPGD